ncbi:MAG: peptidylprolyl isomerase [Neisseria sp.]|nr:peptidylprolyl isomerase [Neisseria sp.]
MKLYTLCFILAAFSCHTASAATPVSIETDYGTVELLLDEVRAPETVANFLNYARKGFYNQTVFHRVIDGFMIQGGGYTADLNEKTTGKAINSEADNGLRNLTGTIAMARSAKPHSATSQFFINLADNGFLNHQNKTPQGYGYTVFGKVVKGMDVVRNIGKTPTASRTYLHNVPLKPVIIRKISIGTPSAVKTEP